MSKKSKRLGRVREERYIYVSKDTSELLKRNRKLCSDNNYLNFHRYIKMVKKIEKNKKMKEYFEPFQPHYSANNKVHREMLERCRELQQIAIEVFENRLTFEVNFEGKLMVSVGRNSIYSNLSSTALHPLYGHPYIPSTALKGAIRNCWIQEKFNGSQERALQNSLFVRCFGKSNDQDEETVESQQGNLIFFDGLLKRDSYSLETEVITPHYSSYYNNRGKEEPTDDQELNVLEIRVLKKPAFMINIAMSNLFTIEEVDEIEVIIKATFEDYGVGAKTAVGYGLGRVRRL